METDGLAHRLPDPDFRGCIQVDADFENLTQEGQVVTFGGIEEWKFVTSDKKTIDLQLDEPLFICIGRDWPHKYKEDGENPFPPADIGCLDEEPVCGYCERPGMYSTLASNTDHELTSSSSRFSSQSLWLALVVQHSPSTELQVGV